MSITHKLHWRYSTQSFDSRRKLEEEDLTEILDAVHLSPSAFNLQPYDLVLVHNRELQEKLYEVSCGHTQVRDASHLVVFAVHKELSPEYITSVFQEHKALDPTKEFSSPPLRNEDVNALVCRKKEEGSFIPWATNQAYLAAGVLLLAAADLQVDACALEYLKLEDYDRILELDANLKSVLVIALGYRSNQDGFSHKKKHRRALEKMIHLRY